MKRPVARRLPRSHRRGACHEPTSQRQPLKTAVDTVVEQLNETPSVETSPQRPAPFAPAVSRACSRRRASPGDSNCRASAEPGSIQAAANGERPGRLRNRIDGRDGQPSPGGRDVEQVVEHLAAGLAEQGVVGAGGLHQRVEPRADPVQAADPHPTARLGVAEDHQGRRGDVAEPPRQQLAPVEPLEHVVGQSIGRQERLDARRPPAPRPRGAGSTSPGRRRRASGCGRTAGPAARRPPAPAPRTPRGAGGRGTCRPGRGLRAPATPRPAVPRRRGPRSTAPGPRTARRSRRPRRIQVERVGQPGEGRRRPRFAQPPGRLGAERRQLDRPARTRATGGRWSIAAGSARRRPAGHGRSTPPAGGPPASGRRARTGRRGPAARRTRPRACRPPRRPRAPAPTPPTRSCRRCRGTSGRPGRCGCRTSRPAARSAATSIAARRRARARTRPPAPPGRPRGTPGRRRSRPASARPSARPSASARTTRRPPARRRRPCRRAAGRRRPAAPTGDRSGSTRPAARPAP